MDTAGFLLVGLPAPAASRSFPLEGQRDVFQALTPQKPVESGPVCPSLGAQLGPALKTLRKTVKALGKKPDPLEVDASNLRRLVRATLSVLEAHRDSFSDKDYRRGTRELKRLSRAIGRYKDAGILETEVRSQFEGGLLPAKIEKALFREKDRRRAEFDQVWQQFRASGLKRVQRSFQNPYGMEATPAALLREDRERNRVHIARLLDRLDEVGLEHDCPDKFHEGRKALRAVLHATLAARETVPTAAEDRERISALVDGLGVAQDSHIAYTWLERKGFGQEAEAAREQYRALHRAELEGVAELRASGALDRLRQATRSGPAGPVSWRPGGAPPESGKAPLLKEVIA